MSINIRHLKYNVKSKPKLDPEKWRVEFVFLNLVFEVDPSSTYHQIFLVKTKDYLQTRVITNIEEYEKIMHESNWLEEAIEQKPNENGFVAVNLPDTSHLEVLGWQYQNPTLTHLPKFNVFQYSGYYFWTPAVQGIIQDLRLLQLGVSQVRTTPDCYLFNLLSALDYLWD